MKEKQYLPGWSFKEFVPDKISQTQRLQPDELFVSKLCAKLHQQIAVCCFIFTIQQHERGIGLLILLWQGRSNVLNHSFAFEKNYM